MTIQRFLRTDAPKPTLRVKAELLKHSAWLRRSKSLSKMPSVPSTHPEIPDRRLSSFCLCTVDADEPLQDGVQTHSMDRVSNCHSSIPICFPQMWRVKVLPADSRIVVAPENLLLVLCPLFVHASNPLPTEFNLQLVQSLRVKVTPLLVICCFSARSCCANQNVASRPSNLIIKMMKNTPRPI